MAFALCGSRARRAARSCTTSTDRLAETWRGVGASVVVDRTRFLNDDETIVVALPDLPEGDCTTVVLLGPRGLGFHARAADGRWRSRATSRTARIPSEAGALSIERCGEALPHRLARDERLGPGRARDDRRALVEAAGVDAVRLAGADAARRSCSTPEPGPPAADAASRRSAPTSPRRARGATARRSPRARRGRPAPTAAARPRTTLDPGCHTLQLFAVDPRAASRSAHGKLDLDAEMRDASGDRILARDRTDAPDARLDAVRRRRDARWGSSSPARRRARPVLVAHFAWPLPERLPTLWGSEARARMAHVLLTRHVHLLLREPVLLAQGGSGATPVPLSIEPGACYLALVVGRAGQRRARWGFAFTWASATRSTTAASTRTARSWRSARGTARTRSPRSRRAERRCSAGAWPSIGSAPRWEIRP